MTSPMQQQTPLNPFAFEKNHKKLVHQLEEERNSQNQDKDEAEEVQKIGYYEKLYQQSKNSSKYGIIRALHDEAQKIAKERDEMFARDHTLDPVMQRMKHFSVRLMHDQKESERQKKNYRIRNILKEKRETIAQYVNKKREIFLSNMNISIKKEETQRLEDFMKNEQESLRARQLYFKNDCELVRIFINEVKIKADLASEDADKEGKKKESQKEELTQIGTSIEKLRLQKTKLKEEYDRLCQYKDFIEKLKTNYNSIFEEIRNKTVSMSNQTPITQEKSKFFVTDVDADKEKIIKQPSLQQIEQKQVEEEQQRMAELLIEILNHIQEKNLQYIQNQHDSEEDLESKRRDLKLLQEILDSQQTENQERLRALDKQKEQAIHQQQKLHQLHKINSSKLQFSDGEDLDMEKIGKLIIEIQRESTKESSKKGEKEIDSKEIHRAMTEVEKVVTQLLDNKRNILKSKYKVEFFDPLERKLKQADKKARQLKTKDDDKIQILQEKLEKKEEYLKNLYKGRKPMYKWFLVKKTGEKKVVVEEKVDDDEKYLEDEYELGYDEKIQSHLENNGKPQLSQH